MSHQYDTVFLGTRLGRTSAKENSLLLILLNGIFTHNHDKDVQTCGIETKGLSRTGFVRAMRNDDACAVVVAREWATSSISNLNPLWDHYFNKDIFVQDVNKIHPKIRSIQKIAQSVFWYKLYTPTLSGHLNSAPSIFKRSGAITDQRGRHCRRPMKNCLQCFLFSS